MKGLRIAATVATIALFVANAHADGGRDPAAAEVLFRAGRDAMKAGDLATACPKFAESQRLDPAPGTLLNLAECEEKSGKLASAWSHLHDAIDQLKPGDDRIPGVKKHEAALDKRVPHLVLSVAPGAEKGRMLRDGVDLGAASLGVPLPVDPGPHEIALLLPGHAEQRVTVAVKEAETRTVTLAPGAAIDDAAPAATASSAAPVTAPPPATITAPGAPVDHPSAKAGGTGRAAGVVFASVGGVSLVAMAVTGVLAIGKKNTVKNDCDAQHVCSQPGVDAASTGKTLSTISTVTGVVGVAALGVGAVLLFTSSSGDAVGVSPLPGGAGASLRGSF